LYFCIFYSPFNSYLQLFLSTTQEPQFCASVLHETVTLVVVMEKTQEDTENKIEPVRAGETESIDDGNVKNMFTQDEYQLAQLGYKQEFFRGLGLFENW
jgi:hypothetical protein